MSDPSVGAHRESDDVNVQIGIYRGLGWQATEIGEILGLGPAAIHKRVNVHGVRIAQIEHITRTAKARYLEDQVKKLEAKADIKQRALAKSWRLKERALDQGLREKRTIFTKDGQEREIENLVSATHLAAAQMVDDRIEGKPLARSEIMQQIAETVTHRVDATDLLTAVAAMERLNSMRKTAYLNAAPSEDVQEAEIVSEPTN